MPSDPDAARGARRRRPAPSARERVVIPSSCRGRRMSLTNAAAAPLTRASRAPPHHPLRATDGSQPGRPAERLLRREPRRTPTLGKRSARRIAFTAVAGASADLPDRRPPQEIQAADLRPLLHPGHDLLLARSAHTERGSRPIRTAPPGGGASTFTSVRGRC
jgi:hypothetical protein